MTPAGSSRKGASRARRATRTERERAILELVEDRAIGTQGELVRALAARGIETTQATVSRDVRRLGLVKTPGRDGRVRYSRNGSEVASPPAARSALQAALREFATGFATGDGVFAIRTASGCANAVAVAIDEAEVEGVVATLAGDDTILVLARDATDRDRVVAELRSLLAGA